MQDYYESPREHYERFMHQKAEQYARGLNAAGLRSNERLTRALFERASQEARSHYIRESTETLCSNVNAILDAHYHEMNAIKRRGHRLRLWFCPLVAMIFGLLAYYNFFVTSQADHALMGIICLGGAAVFVGMLVFGAIFDRPTD